MSDDPIDTPKTLAKRLRLARLRLPNKPSARRLSADAKLAPALVGMIEREAVTNPHTNTLAKLAVVLGVSLQWLAEGQRVEPAHAAATGTGG